jgi:alpha,alpha-trehalose-phosphate synthase [UDP-forming]
MNKLTWKGSKRRLLVVSNRLPVTIDNILGEGSVKSGSGGLVTALAPIVKSAGGVWVGWPGCELTIETQYLIDQYCQENLFNLQPVAISKGEEKRYYRGFSNEALWPLFHDLLGHCKFEINNWKTYLSVNQRFAKKIVEIAQPGDFIWIHDYQLMMVGHFLRQMNVRHPVAFFLHIPFPNYDLLRRLPWKHEIMQGLLDYDLVGFQTSRDRRNFSRSAKEMYPELEIKSRKRYSDIRFNERFIKVGHFPISIDFDEFSVKAKTDEVAREAENLYKQCQAKSLILGVDRLDYTKGIPERLLAFERALEKYPDLIGNLSLLQLAVPSRSHLSAYQDLKEVLEGMVGRINGRFSKFGWQAIQYMYRSLNRTELLGCYRACEIGLLTPLRDGMNLVAKEFCASSIDNKGVLILSEFAGAAEQLGKGALVVNPYNLEETADTIYQAYKMSREEREKRMRVLRAEIKRNDIFKWVDWFLTAFQDHDYDLSSGTTKQDEIITQSSEIVHRSVVPIRQNGE